jgi:hypothetical protein
LRASDVFIYFSIQQGITASPINDIFYHFNKTFLTPLAAVYKIKRFVPVLLEPGDGRKTS